MENVLLDGNVLVSGYSKRQWQRLQLRVHGQMGCKWHNGVIKESIRKVMEDNADMHLDIMACKEWECKVLDVKTAFLQGNKIKKGYLFETSQRSKDAMLDETGVCIWLTPIIHEINDKVS